MKDTINQGQSTAIVSYFTFVGTIIAIFMNNETKNSFAAFHIRQTLGVFSSFFMMGYFIGFFDSWTISFAFYIFYFLLWVYGFIGALNGEMKLIPILGALSQKVFKNL